MKYLLLLFLSVACFSFQNLAQASLDGDWQGWGVWTYQGSGDRCLMHFVFSDSPTQLQRKVGELNCSAVSLSIPSESFIKQGQNLILNGVVVGKMTADHLELHEVYSPTVTIVTNVTMSGLNLDYEEIWYEKSGAVLYKIKGRLNKKSLLPFAATGLEVRI